MSPEIARRRQQLVTTLKRLIEDPTFVDLNYFERGDCYRCLLLAPG